MTDMEKCAIYKRRGDRCTIKCNLGLWSVEGPYGLDLINEASHYFEQYKQDGEYNEILGPPATPECEEDKTNDCDREMLGDDADLLFDHNIGDK